MDLNPGEYIGADGELWAWRARRDADGTLGDLRVGREGEYSRDSPEEVDLRAAAMALFAFALQLAEEAEKNAPTTHELKLDSKYWTAVTTGAKRFEVRFNDRDYREGDILVLRKWDSSGFFLPDMQKFRVTYIHRNLGMEKRYVVLGIEPV